MTTRRACSRFVALLTAAGVAVSANVGSGRAQAPDDPSGRIGRLARLDGTVSSHRAAAAQWTTAVLNFPFSSGDSLWTEPQAQAEVEIGGNSVTLAGQTEFDLTTLDDHAVSASEPQGALFLQISDVRPGDTWTIETPRGAVQIAVVGQYEILAGDASTPTRVVIAQGAAQFTGGSLVLRGGAQQTLVASGTDTLQGDIEPQSAPDAFLASMLDREGGVSAPVPQAAAGMTGVDQLAAYGNWQQSPQYGESWFPQVDPGWAPYREGRWSYVEPWGWTWVDDEPWGFAPFHYGRWFQADGRWGWTPGSGDTRGYEPVYAPALVDFIAIGAAAGLGAGVLASSLRSGHGNIGWVPLGPHEAYRPEYHVSAGYLERLNHGGGWHRPGSMSKNPERGFVNGGAMTVAPAAALVNARRLSGTTRGPAPAPIHPLRSNPPDIARTRRAAPGSDMARVPARIATPAPRTVPGPDRASLPRIQTPFPAAGHPMAVGPHRVAPGIVQHPARPAMPQIYTPHAPSPLASRPSVPFGPRPGMPFGPRPGIQAPRMAPMMRPVAPASPRAAPAPSGGHGGLAPR